MKKKILILSTGGTIACSESAQGLVPTASAKDFTAYLPASMEGDFELSLLDLFQLDSSSIGPSHWLSLAEIIRARESEFDGFLITHGTDTMAYTASALSFLLAGMQTPVVLTGSQLPASVPGSDGPDNLKTAFRTFYTPLTGVVIAFCGQLIRGCRASKLRTQSFHAFESINVPPLMDFRRIDPGKSEAPGAPGYPENQGYQPPEARAHSGGRLSREVVLNLETRVGLLKMIPGMNPELLSAMAGLNYKGLVLELFGVGNFPVEEAALRKGLQTLTDRGVILVTKSQCPFEPCDSQVYAAGRILSQLRPISAGDMTTEAAVTKLMWALGQTDQPEQVRQLFETDIAGEISLS